MFLFEFEELELNWESIPPVVELLYNKTPPGVDSLCPGGGHLFWVPLSILPSEPFGVFIKEMINDALIVSLPPSETWAGQV